MTLTYSLGVLGLDSVPNEIARLTYHSLIRVTFASLDNRASKVGNTNGLTVTYKNHIVSAVVLIMACIGSRSCDTVYS